MNLHHYFDNQTLTRDCQFKSLGHVASDFDGLLVYCESIHYIKLANENRSVSGIITTEALSSHVSASKGLVVDANPRYAFYRLHRILMKSGDGLLKINGGVGRGCNIHPSAQISEGCLIGDGVVIRENAVIRDAVVIGDGTYIDSGAVIGAEGILYMKVDGVNETIRHGGGVIIGRGVTVLSQAVVVRSIHPSQLTTIGDHSIIGISSNIGHDAVVGSNCVVFGNCVVARGAKLDDGAYIGTSCVVREYVTIGANAQAKAGSVVVEDVLPDEVVSGNFAIGHRKRLMQFARDRQ